MRRKDKQIRDEEALDRMLSDAAVCRLAMAAVGTAAAADPAAPERGPADGRAGGERDSFAEYPYVIPLHFAHEGGRIYIHSARTGRKIRMLARDPRVCLEIDEYLGLVPSEKACKYSSRFRSLVIFGTAALVSGTAEKRRALQLLMRKYAGQPFEFTEEEVERVAIIEVTIEAISGKRA